MSTTITENVLPTPPAHPRKLSLPPSPVPASYEEMERRQVAAKEAVMEVARSREGREEHLKLTFCREVSLCKTRKSWNHGLTHVVRGAFVSTAGQLCYVPMSFTSGHRGIEFGYTALTQLVEVEVVPKEEPAKLSDESIWKRCDQAYISPSAIDKFQQHRAPFTAGAFCKATALQAGLLAEFYPKFLGPAFVGPGYEKDIWDKEDPQPVLRLSRNTYDSFNHRVELFHNPSQGFVYLWSHMSMPGGKERTTAYVLVGKDRLLRLSSEWD